MQIDICAPNLAFFLWIRGEWWFFIQSWAHLLSVWLVCAQSAQVSAAHIFIFIHQANVLSHAGLGMGQWSHSLNKLMVWQFDVEQDGVCTCSIVKQFFTDKQMLMIHWSTLLGSGRTKCIDVHSPTRSRRYLVLTQTLMSSTIMEARTP